uniref:Nicotinate phosphoribosyltransferase n=1 Tax=Magnetococcus massalia (strain MO-1) TaxID=451514 RepID=A0A1S7LF75_MAGMO|nr:Nicotinate phosphoribosyltransferase [Candidatus Magnetococcus massalia]
MMAGQRGHHTSLLTDLYQLTMLQSYWLEGMEGEAVYDMTIRRLPEQRNFLVAAGVESAIELLEALRFTPEDIDYLAGLGHFQDAFLQWLGEFRFTGDLYALPEGSIFFPPTPIVQVVAPLPQAQLVETALMNQIHFQSAIASKAARVHIAAGGKPVMEFGLRRCYGADAGLQASRSAYLGGTSITSNVAAAAHYGIPLSGTMAHAFIMSHTSELEAFRAYQKLYPTGALLVDTYDTLEGVRNLIRLRDERPNDFQIKAIRLDSGDLAELARQSRLLLDQAGLPEVKIYVSGGLDETSVAELEATGAPIDAYAVGTSLGVCADAPSMECAYKCALFDGRPLMKMAPGKRSYPGHKQLYRQRQADGTLKLDQLELAGQTEPVGTPQLQKMMAGGQRCVEASSGTLEAARNRFMEQLSGLPPELRSLQPAKQPWQVEIGPALNLAVEQLLQQAR